MKSKPFERHQPGLRHRLQLDRLGELLAEMDADAGPIDPRVMEEVRSQWPDSLPI